MSSRDDLARALFMAEMDPIDVGRGEGMWQRICRRTNDRSQWHEQAERLTDRLAKHDAEIREATKAGIARSQLKSADAVITFDDRTLGVRAGLVRGARIAREWQPGGDR